MSFFSWIPWLSLIQAISTVKCWSPYPSALGTKLILQTWRKHQKGPYGAALVAFSKIRPDNWTIVVRAAGKGQRIYRFTKWISFTGSIPTCYYTIPGMGPHMSCQLRARSLGITQLVLPHWWQKVGGKLTQRAHHGSGRTCQMRYAHHVISL